MSKCHIKTGDLVTWKAEFSKNHLPGNCRVLLLERSPQPCGDMGSGFELFGVDSYHFRKADYHDVQLAINETTASIQRTYTRTAMLEERRRWLRSVQPNA